MAHTSRLQEEATGAEPKSPANGSSFLVELFVIPFVVVTGAAMVGSKFFNLQLLCQKCLAAIAALLQATN